MAGFGVPRNALTWPPTTAPREDRVVCPRRASGQGRKAHLEPLLSTGYKEAPKLSTGAPLQGRASPPPLSIAATTPRRGFAEQIIAPPLLTSS